MTKPELLKLMRLLSALESWSFSTKHQLPDYLLEDLLTCTETLEREILSPIPEQKKPTIDTRVKFKLGSQFGSDLTGHWFYLQPADEDADSALTKHTGGAA